MTPRKPAIAARCRRQGGCLSSQRHDECGLSGGALLQAGLGGVRRLAAAARLASAMVLSPRLAARPAKARRMREPSVNRPLLMRKHRHADEKSQAPEALHWLAQTRRPRNRVKAAVSRDNVPNLSRASGAVTLGARLSSVCKLRARGTGFVLTEATASAPSFTWPVATSLPANRIGAAKRRAPRSRPPGTGRNAAVGARRTGVDAASIATSARGSR